MKYTFRNGSKLDKNLCAAWRECGNVQYYPRSDSLFADWDALGNTFWIKFLESLPGVKSARYTQWNFSTCISFKDESARTMFLLRWS